KKAARRGRTRRPRQGPGHIRSAGTRVAQHLSPRAADALGIGLIVLAALTVLGLWFGAGGPFGRLFTVMVKGLFGAAGYGFPVVAAYWAILLLRGTAAEARGRMLVGLILALAGALAVVSVIRSNPSPAAGYDAVSRAGGVLGAAVAWPLSRIVSVYGAAVVGVGLAALGLLVFTATPLSAVGGGLKRFFFEASEDGGEREERPSRPRRTRTPAAESDPPPGFAPLMPQPEPAGVVVAEAKQIRLPLRGGTGGY